MPPRKKLLLAVALCGAMAATPVLAQQTGKVTSFHGKNPKAADIVRSFMGNQPEPEEPTADAEEPFLGETRGVRPSTVPSNPAPGPMPANLPTPAPSPAPAPAASVQPSTPPSPQPVAGCPTSADAVAIEVNFELNSARLDDQARQTLQEVAKAMLQPALGKCRFTVEGHTDARGSEKLNQNLSAQRAEAVRVFLIRNSVDASRLTAVGKGARELLNTADPLADENRRAQFRIDP